MPNGKSQNNRKNSSVIVVSKECGPGILSCNGKTIYFVPKCTGMQTESNPGVYGKKNLVQAVGRDAIKSIIIQHKNAVREDEEWFQKRINQERENRKNYSSYTQLFW